ncbi:MULTISPECIES: ABC transporter substrate-binding protein [unclassified Kocuria]|uniref:ABC transporter substrate-binding protein n=1 Tax=unclassified Kocuria TaxID=2649579 RepID=UPI00064B6FF7|nr:MULTISPECIES: ABC transporter substrate-binding protein [unclassified Kocuria]KLU08736.1 ABC transporter substrate-binding protein [Kocuria sp. SM24M-10]OLT10000.1 ABC transporter substrate-binding protein [Kocuria sp. CNJ-770]
MAPRRVPRTAAALALCAGLLAVSACAPGDGSPAPTASRSVPQATFVFANAAAAPTLDPAVVSTVETSRIAAQMLEGLVRADPSTGEPVPALATSWQRSADGLTYTFELRDGVRFHDGTVLDADAVCANFERWESLAAAGQRTSFATVFRAADGGTLYEGCTVESPSSLELSLTSARTPVLRALTQPAFGIASPEALAAGTQGTHPVGTGPFRYESGDGTRVVLRADPGYWGELGDIGTLEFRTVAEPELRYVALRLGQVDGYDQVGLDSFAPLAREGVQVFQRDPYSVSYLGINQNVPPLDDPDVREAIAAAVDRGAIVREHYPDGTRVADQFLPARFAMDGTDLQVPSYNPQRARELLAQSSYDGEPLRFYYPRHTSRTYMQEPEKVYADIAAQLVRAGFVIEPVPVDWTDGYVQQVQDPDGDHALHLLGWNGGYRDPDYFMGALFGGPGGEFGIDNASLFRAVDRAAALPDGEERTRAYASINDRLSRLLPAVPLAHPISAVAVDDSVTSFPLTSTGYEEFNRVRLDPAR